MKRSVTWILSAVLLATMATPRSRGADFYVLTNNTSALTAATTLGKINLATGVFTSIVADVGSGAGNLAHRGNYLYFTLGIGGSAKLKRFDLLTQTVDGGFNPSITGSDEPFMGMAYGGGLLGDNFYAWKQNPPRNEFGRINPVTGAWTSLNNDVGPSLTLPPTGGRLANHNGTFYAVISDGDDSSGRFGTVSSGSGFTRVGTADNRYMTMNLVSDSEIELVTPTLYGLYGDGGVGNQRLFTINTVTGGLTLVGISISGSGLGTYFHGAAIVPEPSTYAMGMIAAVTAGWAMRRKKKHF